VRRLRPSIREQLLDQQLKRKFQSMTAALSAVSGGGGGGGGADAAAIGEVVRPAKMPRILAPGVPPLSHAMSMPIPMMLAAGAPLL
jgi:hypothetical protein